MSGADTALQSTSPVAAASMPVVGRVSTRILRGAGALSLGAIVNVVGQIVFVPIALSLWGSNAYGEWVVLTGLVTFLSFTDLGIQSYVTNCMCSSYVRNERDLLQRQLHSALRLQIPLAALVFGIIAVVFALVPVAQIAGFRTISSSTLLGAVLFLAGELLLGVPMGVIGGVYRATGYLPRGAIIGACRQMAMFAVTLGLLAFSRNFAFIAAGRFFVAVLVTLAIFVDLRRIHPWLRLSPAFGTWTEGVQMIAPGVLFIAIPILQYASIQGMITLLQRSHAGSDVSWFSTHRTVVNLAVMISGLLTGAATPELTALYALQKRESLLHLYRAVERTNFWLVSAVLLGMLPFLPLIYARWTAGHLSLDSMLLVLLVVRTILWAWWNAGLVLLFSINRVRSVVLALAVSTLGTLSWAWWLIPRWGVHGAAGAWLLGDLLAAAWVIPSLGSRQIGVSISSEAKAFCSAAFPVLLSASVGVALWSRSTSWVYHFAIAVPVTLLLGAVLLWRSVDSTEKEIFGRMAAKLLPGNFSRN